MIRPRAAPATRKVFSQSDRSLQLLMVEWIGERASAVPNESSASQVAPARTSLMITRIMGQSVARRERASGALRLPAVDRRQQRQGEGEAAAEGGGDQHASQAGPADGAPPASTPVVAKFADGSERWTELDEGAVMKLETTTTDLAQGLAEANRKIDRLSRDSTQPGVGSKL